MGKDAAETSPRSESQQSTSASTSSRISAQIILDAPVTLNDSTDIVETEPVVLTRAKSKFKQQTLRAWHPSYNVGSLYWKFLIAGLIYIPLGIILNIMSRGLTEIVIPYTDCMSTEFPGKTCAQVIEETPGSSDCWCDEKFTVPKEIDSQVYVYYALTNFYQNHRMYVKSRDDLQLKGEVFNDDLTPKKLSDNCKYFDIEEATNKTYFPCGAAANSLFNDSIALYKVNEFGKRGPPIELKRIGLAWDSDKEYKFKNPEQFRDRTNLIWDQFARPKDWGRSLWDLDPSDPDNNGLQNEDFIIWMRTSALSNFRKPFRIVGEPKLEQGDYVLEINYRYKTKSFGGTKSIVLCTTSPMIGSKNNTIGIVFAVIGGIAIIIALVFLYLYVSSNRRNNMVSPTDVQNERGPNPNRNRGAENEEEYILSILQRL